MEKVEEYALRELKSGLLGGTCCADVGMIHQHISIGQVGESKYVKDGPIAILLSWRIWVGALKGVVWIEWTMMGITPQRTADGLPKESSSLIKDSPIYVGLGIP